MNIDIESIQTLLKKYKYIVTVQRTSEGCELIIPSAKLLKRPEIIIQLAIIKEEEHYKISIKYKDEIAYQDVETKDLLLAIELNIITLIEEYANYAYELAQFLDIDGEVINSSEFFKSFV